MKVPPASGPVNFGPPAGVRFCFRRRVTPRVPILPERSCAVCIGTLYMRSFEDEGNSPEDAKDLTQGFFLSLFDRKALGQVTPLKGKFRSFLLASLKELSFGRVPS